MRSTFSIKMESYTGTYFDSHKRIWSGPKRKPLYSSEITLGDLFLHQLSMNPNKIVQVFDPTGETLTATELLEQSKAVAANFIKLGLKPEDVVGLAVANTPNVTAVVIGIFLCGALPHAVYPEFDIETIKIIYDVSRPKIIFYDVENYSIVKQVAQDLDCKIYIVNGEVENVQSAFDLFKCEKESMISSFPCSKIHGSAVAMIMCSSGTSGPPKGVLSTHTVLINQSAYYNMNADSVFFVFSTLYWISGMLTLIESIKNGLKRVITDKPFTPHYFVELVEKHKITHTIINPSQCSQIIQEIDLRSRHRLISLNLVFCGGSKVADTLIPKFDAILRHDVSPGLTVGYGMTEAAGVLVINDEGPGKRKPLTEGRLVPNVQIRIVEETTGNNLTIDEQGMIYFKLETSEWPGYLKNPKATNETLQNGWIKTGDVGYFDKDGYLTICARDSEIFKSAGFQIHPPHIEEIIMQIDGVLEVCVYGIPHDAMGNLIGCAVVVTNDEHGKKLTESDIELHVKNKMAKIYNLTGGVYFVKSLPHSGSGKIIRRVVPKLILKD